MSDAEFVCHCGLGPEDHYYGGPAEHSYVPQVQDDIAADDAMTTDEAAFWRSIDAAQPGDMLPLLVFSDWLQERGDARHRCLGWCARHGKRPTLSRGRRQSDWWVRVFGGEHDIDAGRIPGRLFKWLSTDWARYHGPDCISAAYRDLCEAWLKVTEKARRKRDERRRSAR